MPAEKQKVACVTGAGGSLGSLLTHALVAEGYTVRAVSRSEYSLHRLGADPLIEPILGNILDADVRRRALRGTSLVYHTAAHKHVNYCEDNILEAVRNNVLGTMLMAESSIQHDSVEQFILCSTDKAVYPTTIMGLTKRVCELLMAYYMSGIEQEDTRVQFKVARLCNVMFSRGSVHEIWAGQKQRGEKLTVRRGMWRYFIWPHDAAKFLMDVRLQVASANQAKVFIPAGLVERSLADEAATMNGLEISLEDGLKSEKAHEQLSYLSYAKLPNVDTGIVAEPDCVPTAFQQKVEALIGAVVQGRVLDLRSALQEACSTVTIVH